MRSAKGQGHEKTLPKQVGTVTFNAPGNYVAPYGRTVVKVGGKGQDGTPAVPGNYTGEAYWYSNYDGEAYGGEAYAGTNPPTPGNPLPSYPIGTLYQYTNPPPGYSTYNEFPGYDAGSTPPYDNGFHFVIYGTYYIGGGSNPPTPGNPYYTPYYFPTYSDFYQPTYNPPTPANAGSPANIAGVNFPGGGPGSPAPVVPTEPTTIQYVNAGFSVTVPPGGYVNFENV